MYKDKLYLNVSNYEHITVGINCCSRCDLQHVVITSADIPPNTGRINVEYGELITHSMIFAFINYTSQLM